MGAAEAAGAGAGALPAGEVRGARGPEPSAAGPAPRQSRFDAHTEPSSEAQMGQKWFESTPRRSKRGLVPTKGLVLKGLRFYCILKTEIGVNFPER